MRGRKTTPTNENAYRICYEKVIGHIASKYKCKLIYPMNFLDYKNTADGLRIVFPELNANVFLSNYIIKEIIMNYRPREDYVCFRLIDDLIERNFASLIRK